MPDRTAESELVDLIYAALLGESGWQAFADRLAATLPGGRTTMFFHDVVRGNGRFALTAGFDPEDVARYDGYYASINPWMPKAAVRPIGLGVVADQMLARPALLRSEFHAGFLRPLGCESGVGLTVEREEGRLFLLSILTSEPDPARNMGAADLLTRLAPHLRRALRYYRNGPPRHAVTGASEAAFTVLGAGLLVVGENRRIASASELGQQMLAEERGIVADSRGRLRIADEAADAVLERMLDRLDEGCAIHDCLVRQAGNITRLVCIRIASEGLSTFLEGPSVMVIMEPAPRIGDGHRMDALIARYHLTRAEAEVLAGVVAGHTLDQLAASRGVGRETVRSQLKSIYEKTGVRRQAGLVRLILDRSNAGDQG